MPDGRHLQGELQYGMLPSPQDWPELYSWWDESGTGAGLEASSARVATQYALARGLYSCVCDTRTVSPLRFHLSLVRYRFVWASGPVPLWVVRVPWISPLPRHTYPPAFTFSPLPAHLLWLRSMVGDVYQDVKHVKRSACGFGQGTLRWPLNWHSCGLVGPEEARGL